uniref:Large ribosomal subunit protein uL22c n=1 Tax=Galaxaura rugosa TaxID=268570 RepID=A0A1G4NT01_9FLOR|nr:Ribosomal protein L22 [Galaxaura rugosa]SCW21801.1 Ribosomal protein L22 [Galaxaura rugosa]
MTNNVKTKKIIATGKYLKSSAYKVNRILTQIRGKTYTEAMLILEFMPYRACLNIKKILVSARYNAKNNYNIDQQNLKVQDAFVNLGPKMKRFQPRAQGRAFPIHKPTCHITICLTNLISQ